MLSQPTLEFGGHAAAGLLGVDALYRKEGSGGDGLVVVNMARPGEIAAEVFSSYNAARRWFEALDVESTELAEEDRRTYYRQLCRSTLAFIQWRQNGLPFEDQLGGFLHVPVEPAPQLELDALCEEIQGLLGGMGYHGDLRTQCAAWEDRNRVPPDEVEGVLGELLDEAWERTEERLLEIPAQKDDGMRVMTVSGEAFNARCDYLNRTIELNTDPTLTRPGLKHLAVHEGYPGHYVQFKLRETEFRRGVTAADVLLSVVNTASSSVFEGIADAGMEMTEWVTTDDDRVLGLLNRHRAGIGTGAAWRLHALGWSGEQVKNWLRDQSLVGGEGWVDNRMAFLSAPSRAVLIWSYWWGERVVTPTWRRLPTGRRRDFLSYLFGRMHSNQTVERFA
jgi:hypothetical protein